MTYLIQLRLCGNCAHSEARIVDRSDGGLRAVCNACGRPIPLMPVRKPEVKK